MRYSFECPLCRSDTWEFVESFTYFHSDATTYASGRYLGLVRTLGTLGRVLVIARPPRTSTHSAALSKYERLRRQVIFDVWFRNKDSVQLDAVHCTTCGFLCYRPRPDNDDIAKKYEYLKQYEPDQGGQSGHDAKARALDSARASRVYETCMKHVGRAKLRVLDYGGGNGKLMLPFVEAGHICHLIDYNDQPLPGIAKIGNDIEDFATDTDYDVIICSHVLEHVSDVRGLVEKLRTLLVAGGIIYAEVPQEIWAGLRIGADPVTHINYFTANALSNLFAVNGFRVLENKQQIANYARAYMEVIWLVAAKEEIVSKTLLPSDAHRMLYPSRIYSLKKALIIAVRPILDKVRVRSDG